MSATGLTIDVSIAKSIIEMPACQEETEKNRKKPLESVLGRCCVSPALAEGQFNRLIHGGKGRVDGLAVSHSETRGLEIAEFPRAISRDFAAPREDTRQRKKKFDLSGCSTSC